MSNETFPEFNLFPRLQKVIDAGKFIASLGRVTESCLTNHPHREAEVPLDVPLPFVEDFNTSSR